MMVCMRDKQIQGWERSRCIPIASILRRTFMRLSLLLQASGIPSNARCGRRIQPDAVVDASGKHDSNLHRETRADRITSKLKTNSH